MSADAAIIEQIINEWNLDNHNVTLAEYVAEELAKVTDTRQKVSFIERSKQDARGAMQRRHKELDAELSEIRRTCKHRNQEYYPDPSGNNDSSYICHDCGAEARKRL